MSEFSDEVDVSLSTRVAESSGQFRAPSLETRPSTQAVAEARFKALQAQSQDPMFTRGAARNDVYP